MDMTEYRDRLQVVVVLAEDAYRKAMKVGWSSVYKVAQDQVHDLTK